MSCPVLTETHCGAWLQSWRTEAPHQTSRLGLTHSVPICFTSSCATCTFPPADDIIHVGRHSPPEAVISRVTRLWSDDRLWVLEAFVKPPELAIAEQVGFPIVGPDEGGLHSVHQGAAFPPHPPVGEGSRVAVHGPCVLKDPILRPLENTENVRVTFNPPPNPKTQPCHSPHWKPCKKEDLDYAHFKMTCLVNIFCSSCNTLLACIVACLRCK